MAKLSSTHIFGNLVVDGNINGNADTASKVNNGIKIQLNGGTAENTSQFTFDGSITKNINITPSSIGAATTSTATTNANGLMSSTDKSKLDGIATNANNYSHPTYTSKTSGLYKVTVDNTGHVSATTAVTKADITGLGIPGSDTTYSVATTSTNGLMSSTDKSKLDGIATNANNYSHPTTSGNKHIPSGGSSGQILRWSADGTAVWGNDNNTTYSTGTASASGLTKLYTGAGTATDGTMTQAALKTALDGKAASSHGNHVPTTQTANNAVFLRNDNTWQTVTPANIGAAASSHTHNYAGSSSVGGAANSAVKATQDSAGQQINTTYIKGLSVSGKTITYTKGDGTTGTITTQDTNTTYSTGTASALGLTKLYTGTGTATDGTMTQAAIKTALDGKANSSHGRHIPDACTTITDWNSATTNGWYMGNNATNAPTSGSNIWYFGEVVAHNTNYVIQTVYQFTASTDAKAIPKYIRAKTNGTWGAWTNVTVAKAVPSNAVFTDTNTWRGVQDNLTSTATDQSLSANQGKVLKGLVDGKANSSHTHNSITNQDTRNVNTTPTQMPLGLSVHLKSNSTDGLNDGGTYHSTLMIKGWNDVSGGPWAQMAVTANNNLYFRSSNNDTWNAWKKVSLDGHTHNYASSGHTHNYAGSSSAGGNANAAVKLATARTINGTNFDGSANITTANWGTARNISIADSAGTNTGSAVSVNGSANVTLKLPGTIKATLTGNASTATKATQDSAGQQINTTYIKGLSVSGKTITYTKGDGTTGTITTQDTNTTYSTGTASALGLTKLYTGTGTATDGTMTQAALKTALDGKAKSSHTHTTINSNFTVTDQLFKYKGITPSAASSAAMGGGGYDYVQGCNISIGANSDISSGIYGACLIGYDNITQVGDTFIMGARNESYDTRNYIFGCDNIAEAYDNFIIGQFNTTNSVSDCYVFGSGNTIGGNSSAIKIALGSYNTLNGNGVAIGMSNNVDAYYGAAIGCNTKVFDDGGYAIGYYARAHAYQLGIGHFGNVSSGAKSWGTEGTAFVIGNGGGDSSCSNACRITYAGAVIGKAAYASSGADYAEYFEWLDGNPNNEDRVGYFVTMEGDKIKIAKEGDYLLGVVSGYPAVIGNNDMEWQGQFLTDDFGRPIKEKLTKSVHKDPEDENSEIEIKEYEYFALNPNYNPNEKYIHREDRPEWDTVGMLGVLSVYDDGTCKVNGYCKCNNEGIATACERGFDTYRVIKRVNDRIVKIIFNIK